MSFPSAAGDNQVQSQYDSSAITSTSTPPDAQDDSTRQGAVKYERWNIAQFEIKNYLRSLDHDAVCKLALQICTKSRNEQGIRATKRDKLVHRLQKHNLPSEPYGDKWGEKGGEKGGEKRSEKVRIVTGLILKIQTEANANSDKQPLLENFCNLVKESESPIASGLMLLIGNINKKNLETKHESLPQGIDKAALVDNIPSENKHSDQAYSGYFSPESGKGTSVQGVYTEPTAPQLPLNHTSIQIPWGQMHQPGAYYNPPFHTGIADGLPGFSSPYGITTTPPPPYDIQPLSPRNTVNERPQPQVQREAEEIVKEISGITEALSNLPLKSESHIQFAELSGKHGDLSKEISKRKNDTKLMREALEKNAESAKVKFSDWEKAHKNNEMINGIKKEIAEIKNNPSIGFDVKEQRVGKISDRYENLKALMGTQSSDSDFYSELTKKLASLNEDYEAIKKEILPSQPESERQRKVICEQLEGVNNRLDALTISGAESYSRETLNECRSLQLKLLREIAGDRCLDKTSREDLTKQVGESQKRLVEFENKIKPTAELDDKALKNIGRTLTVAKGHIDTWYRNIGSEHQVYNRKRAMAYFENANVAVDQLLKMNSKHPTVILFNDRMQDMKEQTVQADKWILQRQQNANGQSVQVPGALNTQQNQRIPSTQITGNTDKPAKLTEIAASLAKEIERQLLYQSPFKVRASMAISMLGGSDKVKPIISQTEVNFGDLSQKIQDRLGEVADTLPSKFRPATVPVFNVFMLADDSESLKGKDVGFKLTLNTKANKMYGAITATLALPKELKPENGFSVRSETVNPGNNPQQVHFSIEQLERKDEANQVRSYTVQDLSIDQLQNARTNAFGNVELEKVAIPFGVELSRASQEALTCMSGLIIFHTASGCIATDENQLKKWVGEQKLHSAAELNSFHVL